MAGQPEDIPIYIGYEKHWAPRVCPVCGKTAVWHGFLFREEPPAPPVPDERKAFGHVYGHEGAEDCEVMGNEYL